MRRYMLLTGILVLAVTFLGYHQSIFITTIEGTQANALEGFFAFADTQEEGGGEVEKESMTFNEGAQKPVSPVFHAPMLIAHSAIVMNADTKKVLYKKNADAQLPLASLTKVMSALVSNSLYTKSDRIRIPQKAVSVYGNYGFRVGALWGYQDLLAYSLVTSSNDGMKAIALKAFERTGDAQFVKLMNAKAEKIGLTQTYFLNPTGLDMNDRISGAYGSAKDVALLFQYVHKKKPALLEATTKRTMTVTTPGGYTFTGHNTNEDVLKTPSLLASKTGFTDLAGGNLAITFNAGINQPIIIVVLGSTREGRFTDVQKLIDATIDYLSFYAS